MLLATTVLGLVSFISTLVLTPLTRDLFLRFGLVDQPSGGRKIHATPIPRIGGIAIVISITLGIGVSDALGVWQPFLYNPPIQLLVRLLPAAYIIFLVGLLDDIFTLKAWQKLLGQLLAASVAYADGLRVVGVSGYSTDSWVTLPLTLGWLLLCTNAFNLIDGLDGLAAGAGLLATLTILLAGVLEKNSALVLSTVPLGAALLGFLLYNFNPATAFLGDSGSLVLGFLLGCFGVIWSFKAATVFGMIAPFMAMSVPILDVTLSVLRRFLRGRPIFGADRGHMHHRLLDRGLTHRRVVLLLYGACAFGAALSLLESIHRNRYTGSVIVLFCAGTLLGIKRLGYTEFYAARKMLLGGTLQRNINRTVQLREFETALQTCVCIEDWWNLLTQQCRSFGFAGVNFNYAGRTLNERFPLPSHNSWSVVIQLANEGTLSFSLPRDARRSDSRVVSPMSDRRIDTASAKLYANLCEDSASVVMPFVDIVAKHLPVGLRVLEKDSRTSSVHQGRRKSVPAIAHLAFQVPDFDKQLLEDSVL